MQETQQSQQLSLVSRLTTKLQSFRYNKRYTPPILITLILLGAHLSFGILESYGRLLTAHRNEGRELVIGWGSRARVRCGSADRAVHGGQ